MIKTQHIRYYGLFFSFTVAAARFLSGDKAALPDMIAPIVDALSSDTSLSIALVGAAMSGPAQAVRQTVNSAS